MSRSPKLRLPPSLAAVLCSGALANFAALFLLGKLVEGPLKAGAKALDDAGSKFAGEKANTPLAPAMSLLSAAGEPFTLYPVVGLAAARWLAEGRPGDAITLGMAVAGSAALNEVLKKTIQRPRPLFEHHRVRTSGSSFPSQHLTMSVATYGTLAYLLERRREEQDRRARRPFWIPVVALCSLIGLSRIHQGVHHPTDILGGALAGSLWLTTCAMACNCMDANHS